MTYTKTNSPLPILVSTRIRLDKSQRNLLRDAYHEARLQSQVPDRKTPTGIQVATAGVNSLDTLLGMSSLVFSDIIASRDTISIGIVLKLQNVLGVEVITKKAVLDACERYCSYVFQKAN